MNYDELRLFLKKYYEYDSEIEYCLEKIDKFDAELKEAFFCFIKSGEITDISVNGWTIEKIMQKTRSHEVESFLYLDKMRKDYEYAEFFKFLGFRRK